MANVIRQTLSFQMTRRSFPYQETTQ